MDTESSKGMEPDGRSISLRIDKGYFSICSSY